MKVISATGFSYQYIITSTITIVYKTIDYLTDRQIFFSFLIHYLKKTTNIIIFLCSTKFFI